MKKSIFLLFIAMFHISVAVCQDTIRLLDGNILDVKIERISDEEISFFEVKKARKSFSTLEKQEVYSYSKKGQSETLIYQYNPEIGNIYELKEMQDYMVGERHAAESYRPIVSNILAFGAGVWAGYAISDESHVAVAVPLIFSSILIIPGAKIKKNEMNKSYRKNSAYRDGYKKVAKGKKFLDALKFSGLGMIGSFIIFEATD